MSKGEHGPGRLGSKIRHHARCLKRWKQDHVKCSNQPVCGFLVEVLNQVVDFPPYSAGRLLHPSPCLASGMAHFGLQIVKRFAQPIDVLKVAFAYLAMKCFRVVRQERPHSWVKRHDAVPLDLRNQHRALGWNNDKPLTILKNNGCPFHLGIDRLTPMEEYAMVRIGKDELIFETAPIKAEPLHGIPLGPETYFLERTDNPELLLGILDGITSVRNSMFPNSLRTRHSPFGMVALLDTPDFVKARSRSFTAQILDGLIEPIAAKTAVSTKRLKAILLGIDPDLS